jgi:cutinase
MRTTLAIRGRIAALLGAAAIATAGLTAVTAAPAHAACADVDVVVARGTGEPGQLGVIVGDPVFAALRATITDLTLSSYPVDYPASLSPTSPLEGNLDAVDHLTRQAAACPSQRFILVGYSQGANVMDNSMGISSAGALVGGPIVATIPAAVEPRVAAVLLFGNPIRDIGRSVTGTYAARTLDICAGGDPICSDGVNILAHLSYGNNANQAAAFAADRV